MKLDCFTVGDKVRCRKFDWTITQLNLENNTVELNGFITVENTEIHPAIWWKSVSGDTPVWELYLLEFHLGSVFQNVFDGSFTYNHGLSDMYAGVRHSLEAVESEEAKRKVETLFWNWIEK